jgi:thioredoxin
MPVIQLTTEQFVDTIFDFRTQEKWLYKGTKPAIIDFYADWCGPCKMVAPVLEELSNTYKDDLIIYKVDTETERELAAVFGIQSIPSFLFIPLHKLPILQPGAFPKKVFQEIIEEHLLDNKKQPDS